MGIEKVLLRINNFRKELNYLYLIEKSQRNKEWHENLQYLSNNYINSLNYIKLGKIKINYQINKLEIDQALSNKLINKQQFDNLLYNNKIARLRDIHPVLYFIKDNKVYFMVQTNQSVAVPKPLKDELYVNATSREFISVQTISKEYYTANAIYVIEAKYINDFSDIIEDVEKNSQLKDKFLNNQSELHILIKKEKAFEIFYKKFLKQETEKFSDEVNLFEKDKLIEVSLRNYELLDVTFNKYTIDNIHRISNYEDYYTESWMSYLKLYEVDNNILNNNDPSDI